MAKKGVLAHEIGERAHGRQIDPARKICARCARPFRWRKKWARVWEEVRYCSDACRKQN